MSRGERRLLHVSCAAGHSQVNGFKSDRIAGLLVDFLPNRVGVIPLSLFPLQTETRRLLQPQVTHMKLTTKRAADGGSPPRVSVL